MTWDDINPAEGVYDFSVIQRELDLAAGYGSSISLVVADARNIPNYILHQCETFEFTFRDRRELTCLPWDSTYQIYKEQLTSKLGQEFDAHPNLAAVYFTYSAMTNGAEMHFRVVEAEFTKVGYTLEKLQQAYNTVMDMYVEAFGLTAIVMEIHVVFGEAFLAESAYAHCYGKLGVRCGVAIWWCASRMATDPKEPEYPVWHVAQTAASQSFAVCQTISNFTDNPDSFDQGQNWTSEEALLNELSFFMAEGFKTFEIWTKDLNNTSLVEILAKEIDKQ